MSLLTITSPTYRFCNKDWYIASEVCKEFRLSNNYNTYYSKYFSNNRLLGDTQSYEFRLSGEYLSQFKALYEAKCPSLTKSTAVWLIDKESANKLLKPQGNNTRTTTVESNVNSVSFNLDKFKELELFSIPINLTSQPQGFTATKPYIIDQLLTSGNLRGDNSNIRTDIPYTTTKSYTSGTVDTSSYPAYKNKSKYTEDQISDAITLFSSKLSNTPYQQEKMLHNNSIRLDLFRQWGKIIEIVELKNHTITLTEVKDKLEVKNYLGQAAKENPNCQIKFIFSSPSGIELDALLYLQESCKSIKPHKLIYRPVSHLLYELLKSRENDLPNYYFKSLLTKSDILKDLMAIES